MASLRVFLSYATHDLTLATAVAKALEASECTKIEVLMDRRISAGSDFNEEIRSSIRRSHAVLCLLTRNSAARTWVQHEMAYALGLNIPVVPLVWGHLMPQGMALPLQAYQMHSQQIHGIVRELAYVDLIALVSAYGNRLPLTELANHAEKRTALLIEHARALLRSPPRHRTQLRQRAVMSSFSIPSWNEDDPRWREWTESERSLGYYELARQERIVLEAHVALAGLRLIVCPDFRYKKRQATIGRLEQLRAFLEEYTENLDVEVVCANFPSGNVTIVCGGFVTEAPPPVRLAGLRGTLFNFHAPSVLEAINQFDQEFSRIERSGGAPKGVKRRDWWFKHTLRRIDKALVVASGGGRWNPSGHF